MTVMMTLLRKAESWFTVINTSTRSLRFFPAVFSHGLALILYGHFSENVKGNTLRPHKQLLRKISGLRCRSDKAAHYC